MAVPASFVAGLAVCSPVVTQSVVEPLSAPRFQPLLVSPGCVVCVCVLSGQKFCVNLEGAVCYPGKFVVGRFIVSGLTVFHLLRHCVLPVVLP